MVHGGRQPCVDRRLFERDGSIEADETGLLA